MLENFLAQQNKKVSVTITDFCNWAVKHSASADPDEYLRSMSEVLLSLCVAIKVSLGHSTGSCGKMAGNILDFAYQLRDDMDNWIAAVDEDEVKRYLKSARRKQARLLDSLRRLDEKCSWPGFSKWISEQVDQQIRTPFPGRASMDREVKVTIKILFLAANPSDTVRLRLDEESRAIDESLRKAEFRDRFDVRQHFAVRVADLQGFLLRHKPDIVHFSGHGSESSEIILEDNNGNSQSVSARALSTLFSVLKDNIRCVVLNACYSEPQAQAIAEHVDCVVGMSESIGDAAAISFASAFYQALGFGKNVKIAFDLGCVQIDLESLDEQDTPKLLAVKSNPEEIVFVHTD